MSLVETRCRHLRDFVSSPSLAEFPHRPPDGRPLHPRVDCLREVVEHLRDEVLVASQESRRVQRVAATTYIGTSLFTERIRHRPVNDTNLISTPITLSLALWPFFRSDPFSSAPFPFMATEVAPFPCPLSEEVVVGILYNVSDLGPNTRLRPALASCDSVF